ncbi:Hypothetical predicted protein [Lynx pardinus]|uniref:Soluble scavenger receptor cysteine-rich domain-containing protein SSC5D n=1 Tax=Lynx pardinus TaxID=191816 RepID=A0A485N0K1_LYNPA|nr:Hypothetical predicted protein [Lynx pardinus]
MQVQACLTPLVGPAPRLRLADGPHGCAGRLEVWHGGRWGTVCDDAWDLRDASVACRELGCGGALAAPGGAFFGEGAGPILLDDLRCRGNETALRLCPARPWGQHDCHHREDAGAVCDGMPLGYVPPTAPAAADGNHSASRDVASGPPPPTASQASRTAGASPPPASPTAPREPEPEAGSPQLRLVAGPSRCSGRLEVWHAGRWGTVCDDSWDLRDAAVVCRELGCGGARQPDPAAGRFGWGAGPIWLDDVGCLGTEASLSDCPAAPWGKHNCAHNEDVGVTCTETPGLDSISDPFSWSWIPGLGRDPDAWLPGELATKPSARLTPSVPEKTTTKAPGKMPKSTKKWVTKNAKRPTTQPPVMPTTKHSRVLGTQRPLELTSRTTTTLTTEASHRAVSESTAKLTTGVPHGMTSHTTATRTPRAPRERTSKAVATSTTQGPREVTSEATATRIPLTPKESSAEIPAQGSPESPKDPAPSPTGSTTRGSGPFRVRLADGPNRCAGRLEVWHAGRWGTVCDDSWDLRDSTVACWELGCGRVRPRVGKTHYGPGTGPIWLDDVGCKGIEASLSDCPAGAWGQHNCDHEEDVGLTCTGTGDGVGDPESLQEILEGMRPELNSGMNRGSKSRAVKLSSPYISQGDKDGYESFRTWDTPSGGALPKGTPTTLTTGTTRDPDHPSPAPRIRGDTGSERKLWPQRRLLRPTSSRTVPPAPSPDPSASSEPPGSPVTSVTSNPAPWFIPEAASTRKSTTPPHSTSAQPTTTPHPITTSYPATTPDSTMTPHSTTSTHPTMTADPTSTPVVTVKSILTSLGTEFSPTPAPAVKPSLHPWLTSMGAAHLSQMSSLVPFPASESSHPRSSPGPSMDTLSTEDFQPPRSQSPKPTPPPTQTPHSASDPTGTSDLHLSSMVHPLDQPPPDHFTLRPTPGQDPDPVGPCVTPAPPVKVMACEPPALVELVAAVRDVSGQLQRLTQVLKQDQQQRQALELGLTQLVEATRGLGQLGEVVKRLAERAWPPSTPAPTTTTPEEEERPLRGDV